MRKSKAPPLAQRKVGPLLSREGRGRGGEDQWLRDRIWQTIGKSAREGENPVKVKSACE